MKNFEELLQKADWKKEKHTPVIEIIGEVKKEKNIKVEVSVGKEIPHPNTTAHHISWIEVYFLPEGETFPYQVARFDFVSHGASTKGADTSGVYTEPFVSFLFKTTKSGTLYALSFCNIHGLWINSLELKVE